MATTGGGQRCVAPEVIARRERRPAVLEPHGSLASRVRTMAPRGVRPLQWPWNRASTRGPDRQSDVEQVTPSHGSMVFSPLEALMM
jgi:hypothetical protein